MKKIICIITLFVFIVSIYNNVFATDMYLQNETMNNESVVFDEKNITNNVRINNTNEPYNDNMIKDNNDEIEKDVKETNIQEEIIKNSVLDLNTNKSIESNSAETNLGQSIQNRNSEIEEENEEFNLIARIKDGTTIKPYVKNAIYYMFVPQNDEIRNLIIDYTGNIIDVEGALIDKDNKQITGDFTKECEFKVILNNDNEIMVKIYQSDVPAIFVDLKNDVSIETINGGSKDIKYGATIKLLDSNEINNLIDSNAEIKGRGNTSWIAPKKSYQIKFNKKQNPFGIGNAKNKKWVLIANYNDDTLIKNKLMNDLCVNSELSNIPNSMFIDLYINSEYIGNYLLCDKIEINNGRIELENEEGGLFELDNAYYKEEDYYFRANISEDYFAAKESVNEDKISDAGNIFKKAISVLERGLYGGNKDWNYIKNLIDLKSFAKYYLVNEFSKNQDTYYSSTYFYQDGPDDKIHMGPTWDYDKDNFSEDVITDYTLNVYSYNQSYMRKLYEYPQFAIFVNNLYQQELKTIFNSISVKDYAETIEASSKMNNIVWNKEEKYERKVNSLDNWVDKRIDYFNERYAFDDMNVFYSSHIENKGWDYTRVNGETSGTVGKGLRLEGIRIMVTDDQGENIPVRYRTHIQDYGWTNWRSDGTTSGTVGESKRIEAIRIKLDNNPKYSIKYRTHVQDYGWTDWKYDGEISGTTGLSKRIEAIEIKIIDNINVIGSDDINDDSKINYQGHIENIGNTGFCSDGEILGTIGRSLRLEGLKISLGNQLPDTIGLKINEHIQDIGWKYGLTEKDYIGTKGQSRRIEAISLKLTGEESEKYRIKYRTHVQDIGWQSWKADGQIAGTTGKSKRVEAIQIIIEEK